MIQACPGPAPVPYHNVSGQKNVAWVGAENGNQRKDVRLKRGTRKKSAQSSPKQEDMLAELA